jgi:MOSC domain-containing protein YiiM
MDGKVESVNRSPTHTMAKPPHESITLLAGLGVEGDAHMGATVQHASRDHSKPNLRQVHLIPAELHDELRQKGFDVDTGEMGENVTTRGIDLLALPEGARLHLGGEAVIEVTGLRTPCDQLNGVRPGLLNEVLDRDEHGNLIRRAGIMSIVLSGGEVRPGDQVRVELPQAPHQPLGPV